jgi:hypothetical protein
MNNNVVNDIRDNLRVGFKNSELEQSLDKRYSIQTAHSTIIRFRRELNQKRCVLKLIDKYVDHDFELLRLKNGTCLQRLVSKKGICKKNCTNLK